jgi:hypothetical protein
MPSSHSPDTLVVAFDHDHAVANAGLLLPATLAQRLGIECELAIRDHKDGAGLRHCSSGRFLANAAWLVIATLAHNLLRWVAALGLGVSSQVVAKTLRRRLLTLHQPAPRWIQAKGTWVLA